MLRSLRLWILTGEERQLRKVTQHAEHPVEQADIDQTSTAGDTALMQRRQNGHRSIDPADQVAERDSQFHGRAIGFAIDTQRTR